MRIEYTGEEDCILKIINSIQGSTKAVRVSGNSITIPTDNGARQVFIGDVIVIDGANITVIR